jgi:hypothetical protein
MRVPFAIVSLSLMLVAVAAAAQDSPGELPKVVQHSQPIYPPLARQTRIQGDVRVKLTTDGESVIDAEAVVGHPLLRKAAEDNVRTWKFARHNPSTFYITFRYKLASGDVDVEFLNSPAIVEIEAPLPLAIIDDAWVVLGKWKVQLKSSHGKSWQTLKLFYSGPDGEWLDGNVVDAKGESDEIDFGHKEGDFLAFTIRLRQPDGNRLVTFFVGRMKENKIVGTFVDDGGTTGEWTGVRIADSSKSP